MTNLNIEQNNEVTKRIDDSLLEHIYNISKGLDSSVPQYMKGRLEIVHGYADAIDFLEQKFSDLYIISTGNPYIRFKDSYVQQQLANKWGDGVGLTVQQAQVQTSGQQLKTLFARNTDITSFDELKYFIGIKELPSETFRACSNLKSIDLVNIERITGYNCFTSCNKLTNIGDYSNLIRVDPDAFNYTDLSGEYDFSNITEFNNSSKEALGFSRTSNLISVKMPATQETMCNFYGSSVHHITNCLGIKYIGHEHLRACENLEELDCPNLETIASSSALSGCKSLKTVNFPNLISLGNNAFYGCTSLESIDFPKLTTILGESNFSNCTSLQSVNLPLATTITKFCFRDCSSLTSISIPNVTSLGQDAFNGCTSLTSISIPLLEQVNANGGQFNNCKKLSNNIEFPYLNITNNNAQYMFYNCELIPSITLGEVTYIPNKFFSGCKSLAHTNIDFTKVTDIGEYAFEKCEQLCVNDTITFSSLTTSLTAAKLSGFRAPHLIYSGLTTNIVNRGANEYTQTVKLNSNVTELSNQCFITCKKLISVSNLDNVITVGNECFRYDSELTSLDFSSNLKSIGNYAFSGCNKVEYISTETIYPTSIGNHAFDGCSLLKGRIDISQCKSLNGYTFFNCSSLTSIGSLNLELTSIGQHDFNNCGLTGNLDIPVSVTSLGDSCFRNMKSLTSLTFNSDTPPTRSGSSHFDGSSYIIYVPASAVDTYKVTWTNVASRIQAKP